MIREWELRQSSVARITIFGYLSGRYWISVSYPFPWRPYRWNDEGDSVVFLNAEVYASKVEYDAWMAMPAERKAQVVKTMDAYKERLHLFEFGDTLPGNVVAMEAVGHTPGHTVFQSGKLLVIGDLIHGAALQLEHPEYCASYDMDKGSCRESTQVFPPICQGQPIDDGRYASSCSGLQIEWESVKSI